MQLAFVATALADSIVGSVTSTEAVAVQPLASVTVTLYVPAERSVISSVTALLLHTKVYGAVPPVTVKSAAPFVPPLQLTLVATPAAESTVGSVIVTEVVAVHPPASVTVTV